MERAILLELDRLFGDVHGAVLPQLAALTRLEGTSWYQAKDSVEDYIDWFQELIDVAEYDDDKTIVIKFRKGQGGTYRR